MKKATLFLLLGISMLSYSQDMEYNMGYLFKKSFSERGDLFLVQKKKGTIKTTIDTVGYFMDGSNQKQFILNEEKKREDQYVPKEIFSQLKGTITKKCGDSIYVSFWNIYKKGNAETAFDKSIKLNSNIINEIDNGKAYVYVIKNWKTTAYGGKYIDIPYRFYQLMATNIPFRILTNSGKLESDFLNANATFLKVSGHARLFENKYIKQRNRSFAYGPFVGLSSIDNPVTDKKEFGLNYGVNVIGTLQGLNVIAAYGFQNGFKSETNKVEPYLGFGIGFKIFETFSPEIKIKEEE